tara:strand:- start:185 stop:625 length:441 start_codon:yes stop_codon:yes gene_type:complete
MYLRWGFGIFLIITFVLQVRNFNRYHVERKRKHVSGQVYLNSDVCTDAITRSQLGTFNLCEKAEQIVNESPFETAMYDVINDWYPCGHGRCDGAWDWLRANIHWFLFVFVVMGMMLYFKWVEHQRDIMFTRMRLPTMLQNKIQHVD